ncbi:MAG: thymidine kinase [Myxococcales bacterium]|nr:thymidine kinase [Myxococcales bacterium]|tara:strand:- start:696 stop:1448 length:753 start_codon:yes stop_codon:yes gene_type:complete
MGCKGIGKQVYWPKKPVFGPAHSSWEVGLNAFDTGGSAVGNGVGQIEVVCGPMFSGKTEELIRRLRRAMFGRQRVIVFKPQIDNRYAEADIVSHTEQRLVSVPVENSSQIDDYLRKLEQPPQVIGVDEAQFFDKSLIPLLERLANSGLRVVAAGLDQDYLGKPFTIMPELLAVADYVTKQQAVCVVCGASATKSQRVHPRAPVNPDQTTANGETKDQILVGAGDAYEARCRRCHVKTVDIPHFLEPPRVV